MRFHMNRLPQNQRRLSQQKQKTVTEPVTPKFIPLNERETTESSVVPETTTLDYNNAKKWIPIPTDKDGDNLWDLTEKLNDMYKSSEDDLMDSGRTSFTQEHSLNQADIQSFGHLNLGPFRTKDIGKYIYFHTVRSNPYKMFAANFQPSWPSRPQTKGILLFCFLKLYNFGFYEIFVGSTGSEVQHPWILKIRCEPKKSRKNHFSGSNLKCF